MFYSVFLFGVLFVPDRFLFVVLFVFLFGVLFVVFFGRLFGSFRPASISCSAGLLDWPFATWLRLGYLAEQLLDGKLVVGRVLLAGFLMMGFLRSGYVRRFYACGLAVFHAWVCIYASKCFGLVASLSFDSYVDVDTCLAPHNCALCMGAGALPYTRKHKFGNGV